MFLNLEKNIHLIKSESPVCISQHNTTFCGFNKKKSQDVVKFL
ncbi:hypothetical protein GAMM_100131 [Gammaproteobacteria bacterium]